MWREGHLEGVEGRACGQETARAYACGAGAIERDGGGAALDTRDRRFWKIQQGRGGAGLGTRRWGMWC